MVEVMVVVFVAMACWLAACLSLYLSSLISSR